MHLIEHLKHALLDLHAAWVMWLLLGLFAVSVVVTVERALFFYGLRDDLPQLASALDASLRAGEYAQALSALKASRSSEAAAVAAGLKLADLGPASAEKAMIGALALERMRMERGLAFLGTLGNNAPFVGLLGTVIGVIEAFEVLGQPVAGTIQGSGPLAPTAIMSSIAEALVATAVGLFVAIPSVAAYNYFQRRISGTLANADALTNVLLAHLVAEEPLSPVARDVQAEA